MTVHTYDDPFAWFQAWFEDAQATGADFPEAMSLATVDAKGQPSARVVLLKAFSPQGLVFYTNTDSAKGRQIAANDKVALCFHWNELARQVRVQGRATLVSDDVADAYFASRPRGSQIGAWASLQSQMVGDFAELDARMLDVERKYDGQPVPRPPHWSGYEVVPTRFEFWQGREYRMHYRWEFNRRIEGDGWLMRKLQP